MLFRFGSAIVALLCLQASAGVHPSADEEAWLKRSRKILEESAGQPAPEWLRQQATQEALAAAESVAAQSNAGRAAAPGVFHPTPGRVLIFGSFSIPDVTMRQLLTQACDANVVFVLRGIPSGATIQTTLVRLKRLIAGQERVPNVILDPTLFRRYGIDSAPTLVLERDGKSKPISVTGAVTVDWLRRVAVNVSPGGEALGRRAETYEIAEPDFILDMQKRLAGIDWNARRQAAIDKFWQKPRQFIDLPDARSAKVFLVDPSVRVTEDLQDDDGSVLMHAGGTVNPLDWVPLSKTIIIFRGTDARHVAKAAEAARAARALGRDVILLTTTVDTGRGWQHLNDLERTLSGSVYLLPISLVDRFHLTHIPVTVAAKGKQLVVTEMPAGDTP